MEQPTPEQEAQFAAELAKNEQLLTIVMTAATAEERIAAGRELGITSPEGQPLESSLSISMMRTEDRRWWGCLRAGSKVLSQAVMDTAFQIALTLGGAAALICNTLASDEEHVDLSEALKKAGGG